MGENFKGYEQQLDFISGVTFNETDIPNLVSFSFTSGFYKKFEDRLGEAFKLINIRVKDLYSGKMLTVSAYFSYGIFNAYVVDENISNYEFDPNTIIFSDVKKVLRGDKVRFEILSLLTKKEVQHINSSDIYSTFINGTEYFHIRELEDGDFIGITRSNEVYKITHDPFEIVSIKRGELIKYLEV
ncbi:hypothetical protein FAZ15_05630 [Sphingobacterium olei]|uniref:Uncharacterized protein n=1 Tax=Sphingobacterium olei TaxID=2571155 RepID=A0A4U0P3W8_9SPHI|nr:hypothetical protein [Sphingobacterium olei]TJZ61993.1 hypothetical protein FAZ15_05630 [Sphingobacterium olei]